MLTSIISRFKKPGKTPCSRHALCTGLSELFAKCSRHGGRCAAAAKDADPRGGTVCFWCLADDADGLGSLDDGLMGGFSSNLGVSCHFFRLPEDGSTRDARTMGRKMKSCGIYAILTCSGEWTESFVSLISMRGLCWCLLLESKQRCHPATNEKPEPSSRNSSMRASSKIPWIDAWLEGFSWIIACTLW